MGEEKVRVLLYSDDETRRAAVINGVGIRPGKDLPEIEWIPAATAAGAIQKYTEFAPQVLVLDAESTKVGGMSVAKNLENEHGSTAPIVLLTARPQDRWLGEWAGATVIVDDPLDPVDLQEALSTVVRSVR